MTPLRAVRAYCIDCSGDNKAEVRKCPIHDCPLYRYRMGHNPAIKRQKGINPFTTAGREKTRSAAMNS